MRNLHSRPGPKPSREMTETNDVMPGGGGGVPFIDVNYEDFSVGHGIRLAC